MVQKVLHDPDKFERMFAARYLSKYQYFKSKAILLKLLEDDDLVAFIRLGSDYKGNYYEYEIPLKVTLPGRYDNDNSGDRARVWPRENHIEIVLDVFQDVKQARNDQMRLTSSSVSYSTVYSGFDSKGNRVSVKGNPNLSNVKTLMLGIRNPKAGINQNEEERILRSLTI